MLIATHDAVYATKRPDTSPVLRLEAGGILHVAEGRLLDAVATDDGRLAVLRKHKTRTLEPDLDKAAVTSLLLVKEDPLEVLLGTEPAHVFRQTGEGAADRCAAFDALSVRDGWYTPWGGPPAVRSLAGTPDGWVYADIHVGSIMASPDRGATWKPVKPDLNEDVHQVATCPAAPDRVYANTARAVWISEDRGRSWAGRGKPLGHRYGRAIAVHPDKPDHCLASVSDGPHGKNVHGRLYRTTNAGRDWDHVADGFPDSTPHNIDTFHLAVTGDGTGWACVGPRLYAGPLTGGAWRQVWEAPDPIAMLAVAV
jgi:hypothetical protein